MMQSPINPIAAVTHHNPYPYYADLVANRPMYRDESMNLWVAASAEAVTTVLTSDLCHVRPLTEPVPKALLGSLAGDIFRQLVRMNDGQQHSVVKQIVSSTLRAISMQQITEQSSIWARY